jgi:hypothetical protein
VKPEIHDFLGEYPDAQEDVDSKVPKAYGKELETSIFFDLDHAHNHKTRHSITGLIVFAGRTPVSWSSKRQGCISTSTYCAEFMAMRSGIEEAISLRHMLRCLGIPVNAPTNLYGDNKVLYRVQTYPMENSRKSMWQSCSTLQENRLLQKLSTQSGFQVQLISLT